MFVVLVQGDQGPVQAQMVQQAAADARVFAGYRVDQAQHMDSAQAQIGQIADRCGHHIKRGCGILLTTGCGCSRLHQQGGINVQEGLSQD